MAGVLGAADVAGVQDFPPLPADGQVKQRNEGRWDFTLQESDDG